MKTLLAGIVKCSLALYAIDGDTIMCDTQMMRDMGDGEPYVSGYDAPEIFHPKCAEELALGLKAKARMSEMLKTPGVTVVYSGRGDSFGRPLVWVVLPSHVTVGHTLIAEGLARRWYKGYRASWCSK